jgi:hypothetical protein
MDKKVAFIVVALLTGCGGGGGGSGQQVAGNIMSTSVPQGTYTGATSNGRTAAALVLPDGSFFVIYTAAQHPDIIGGAIQGSLTAMPGTFFATDVKDINFEGAGVLTVGVQGSYVPKQSFNAAVNYLTLGQSITVRAGYLPGYDTPASLASITGSYVGSAGGTERVDVGVSATGSISGISSGGCRFTGQASPLQTINAFKVVVNFGAAPCATPGQSVSGAAVFDAATRILYAVAMLGDRSNGFVFSGTKL